MHMAAQSFRNGTEFCAPSSGCESVMNAVHSSQYSTENLLVKASAVASIASYCKQGGRRDATSCMHCTARSGDAKAAASSDSSKGQNHRRRISQDPGRPTGVSMKNFAF